MSSKSEGIMTTRRIVMGGVLIAMATFSEAADLKSDLRLWLTADSLSGQQDGEKVSVWRDLSGNGLDVDMSLPEHQPILRKDSLNGRPTIYFDDSGTDSLVRESVVGSAGGVGVRA